MNFSDLIDSSLKTIIDEKLANFKDFVYSIVPEHKKKIVENSMNDLEKYKWKLLMFLLTVNKKNIDNHVNDFTNKFEIEETHKDKIKDYYTFFIEVKEILTPKK